MRKRSGAVAGAVASAVVLALWAGCGEPEVDGADAPPVVDSDAGAGGGEAAGDAPDEASEASPVCLRGEPFVADGEVGVESVGEAAGSSAAERVGGIRWQGYEGCERVVVDLEDAESAAAGGPGEVRAEVIRELGVVRVELRDVEWVDPEATEARFEGPLARRAYAFFSPEGRWVSVDVHMGEAVEAYVATLGDPARVLVDLRPGGGPVPEPAPEANQVVVLEPRPGPASYPLEVTGYARTFEANVVVRLEHEGEEVYDDFTTATAWADAWGHYTFTIPEGPSGEVVLHVGEHSARDGSWEGVEVPLELR